MKMGLLWKVLEIDSLIGHYVVSFMMQISYIIIPKSQSFHNQGSWSIHRIFCQIYERIKIQFQ